MKRKLKRMKYVAENVYHVDWVTDGLILLGYVTVAVWYVGMAIMFLK